MKVQGGLIINTYNVADTITASTITASGITASTIVTTERIQITSGATDGYVLTSDAIGNAIWQATQIPSNVVVGSGTTNYVAKWDSSSGLSSTSLIYDDGTNVGIGTTSPSEKLEVSGRTKTTNFQMTSGATNGYILTSDASGNASWNPIPVTSGIFGIPDSNGAYTYYSTLSGAMSAATSGQTIEQFADITETGAVTINWKDGVNFNGNGHTYIHSYPSGDSNTINLPSTTVTCTIFNWRVIRTNRSNGTATDFAFYVTPGSFDINNSVVKFTGVYIESTYGNAVNFNAQGGSYNGTLYAKAYLNAITSYSNILDGLYGESTSSGYGLANGGNGTTNCIGKSVSGRGLYGYGNVRNCFGISTSGIGLGQGSNGTGPYYNCVGVSTSSAGGSVGTFYNCTLLSTSGIAGDGVGGSNNTLISSSNYAWYSFFPGYKTTNSFLLSSSNVAAATRGAILKNCVIRSDYNNANGHAISEWIGGSVSKFVNCDLEVTNSSANCVNSSSAVNMKIAGCSFDGATTPINANITQSLINTQDNQGNILL